MPRLTQWTTAAAMTVGLMFAGDTPQARADHGCYRPGIGISIGVGSPYGHHSRYRSPYYSSRFHGGYGHRGSWYHDTTHYDYHPRTIRRHGNHWHVQPGHYDLHRSGHWHH